MGRPKHDPNRVATKIRLLNAAESAFGASGFASARLSDIAREAGVRRPSLLHHFGTKRTLYEAVVARAFADLRREIEGVPTDGGFAAVLDEVTRRLMAVADARPGIASLVVRELLDGAAASDGDDSDDIIAREMLPLVAHLEALVRDVAGDALPSDFPVRDAIVAMMTSYMVKVAAGRREALWPNDATPTLIRALFLGAMAT